MFGLKAKQDGFRLLLPNEFIPEEINNKYSKILQNNHGYYLKPIDFVNETIQKVQVLGFSGGTIVQKQRGRGEPTFDENRVEENNFLHMGSDYVVRSPENPLNLIDKTLNIDFRHTLGYLNYFIIFESFFYHFSRDWKNKEMPIKFVVDILNEKGSIYSRILLDHPVIDSMDMLSFDYTQPIASSQTFRVSWKYSNFNFQFMEKVEES